MKPTEATVFDRKSGAAEGSAVRPRSRTKVSVPSVFPQNRHPERSAAPIDRVTHHLWRGVEGPRRRSAQDDDSVGKPKEKQQVAPLRFARPERSVVEGPAVSFCQSDLTAPNKSHRPPICHPDRSVAQWTCGFSSGSQAASSSRAGPLARNQNWKTALSWTIRGEASPPRNEP
jgi:hypothetical protein